MSAFVVILPEESAIEEQEVVQAFQHCHELVTGRAWLVSDDECLDSDDVGKLLKIGEGRLGLVTGVTDYAGYGERRLGKRLRKWANE